MKGMLSQTGPSGSRCWSCRCVIRRVMLLASLFHATMATKDFVVGSGTLSGEWTSTLNGANNASALQDAYAQWASSVNVSVGDSLTFQYEAAAHTVVLVQSEGAFNSCNGTGGQEVTGGPPTIYTVKSVDPPTLYFICTVSGHCQLGQKMAIPIKATPLQSPQRAPASSPVGSRANVLRPEEGVVLILFIITFFSLLALND